MFYKLLKLTRWKEHVIFVVPITLLGSILAVNKGGFLDIKVIYVLAANTLAVSYAFMINDVEDAVDDARDPDKKVKNQISNKNLSVNTAWTAIRITAAVSLFFYALTNYLTLAIGVVTLLLSHLYSWRKIRLKAMPVADVLSHSLILAGLLLVTGYTAYSASVVDIWFLVVTVSLASVYGQLYNQLRDFDVDVKAGLRNTTITLGKKRTQLLMNSSIFLTIIGLLNSVYSGVFPFWLIFPLVIAFLWVRNLDSENDSRGTKAMDITGRSQAKMHFLGNVVILSWLVEILFIKMGVWNAIKLLLI